MRKIKKSYIAVLFVILVLGLAAILALDHFSNDRQSSLRSEADKKKWDQRVDERKIDQQKRARKSVYAKLSDESSISMAIIGDNMGFQLGRYTVETGWMDRLRAYLVKMYHSELSITDRSFYDWDVYKCYYDFMNRQEEKYDIVFLFFGYNEKDTMSVKEFEYYYEALIRQIQERCNYPEIIMVLESSMDEYSEYTDVIRKLGKYYNYPVADTLAAFQKSSLSVKKLTRDMMHPNDKGYQIYFNVISKIIDKGVAEEKSVTNSRPEDWRFKPKYPIGEPRTITLGQMIQEDAYTYSYETKYHHVGVSYQAYQNKKGQFTVLINGKEVKNINCQKKLDVEKADIVRLNLKGKNTISIRLNKKYASATKVNGLILY